MWECGLDTGSAVMLSQYQCAWQGQIYTFTLEALLHNNTPEQNRCKIWRFSVSDDLIQYLETEMNTSGQHNPVVYHHLSLS